MNDPAAPGGEPSGPLSARSLQRRDRDQDHREQAGRGGLSHLDLPLPPDDPEPQLLQHAGRHLQTPVGPPVRDGGEHAGTASASASRRTWTRPRSTWA